MSNAAFNSATRDTELLSAYLDDALDAGERVEVEQLLHTNPSAVARLEALRRVSTSVARLERLALPPTFDVGTIQRLALLENRRGLFDRVEDSVPEWQRSSHLLLFFALITALSVMGYFLAAATWNERHGLTPIVLDPPPEHRIEDLSRARTVYVNGRLFERSGRIWVESGIDSELPAREISASGREGSRLLAERPDLRSLLALDQVVVRHESEIIRLIAADRPKGGL